MNFKVKYFIQLTIIREKYVTNSCIPIFWCDKLSNESIAVSSIEQNAMQENQFTVSTTKKFLQYTYTYDHLQNTH